MYPAASAGLIIWNETAIQLEELWGGVRNTGYFQLSFQAFMLIAHCAGGQRKEFHGH